MKVAQQNWLGTVCGQNVPKMQCLEHVRFDGVLVLNRTINWSESDFKCKWVKSFEDLCCWRIAESLPCKRFRHVKWNRKLNNNKTDLRGVNQAMIRVDLGCCSSQCWSLDTVSLSKLHCRRDVMRIWWIQRGRLLIVHNLSNKPKWRGDQVVVLRSANCCHVYTIVHHHKTWKCPQSWTSQGLYEIFHLAEQIDPCICTLGASPGAGCLWFVGFPLIFADNLFS